VDAVASIGPAVHDLPQKKNLFPTFPDRHIVVPHARMGASQVCQLMVVGREESPGADPVAIGQTLCDGPGYAEPVECARPPSDLVEDDQAPRRGMVEDVG